MNAIAASVGRFRREETRKWEVSFIEYHIFRDVYFSLFAQTLVALVIFIIAQNKHSSDLGYNFDWLYGLRHEKQAQPKTLSAL